MYIPTWHRNILSATSITELSYSIFATKDYLIDNKLPANDSLVSTTHETRSLGRLHTDRPLRVAGWLADSSPNWIPHPCHCGAWLIPSTSETNTHCRRCFRTVWKCCDLITASFLWNVLRIGLFIEYIAEVWNTSLSINRYVANQKKKLQNYYQTNG